MKNRRIFIHREEIVSDEIVLSRQNARYVAKVLRYKPGDLLKVFDGRMQHLVRLIECRQNQVSGRIIESVKMEREKALEIVLGFCCVRPGPMEEILRHGTELGVSRFVPLVSLRSNRKPEERKARWQNIVAAAATQSGRGELPVVEPPMPLHEFIGKSEVAGVRILLSTQSAVPPLIHILDATMPRRVVLLVGPEGGLDPVEDAQATEAGFRPASLGQTVLRTETAVLAATGIIVAWNQARCWNDRTSTDSSGPATTDSAEPVV